MYIVYTIITHTDFHTVADSGFDLFWICQRPKRDEEGNAVVVDAGLIGGVFHIERGMMGRPVYCCTQWYSFDFSEKWCLPN